MKAGEGVKKKELPKESNVGSDVQISKRLDLIVLRDLINYGLIRARVKSVGQN